MPDNIPNKPAPLQNPDTLRDHLAAVRTTLANQRTLLAFIRTALTFLLVGLSLLKFFDHSLLAIIGWTLILAGIATVIAGTIAYIRIKKSIDGKGSSLDT